MLGHVTASADAFEVNATFPRGSCSQQLEGVGTHIPVRDPMRLSAL